MIEKHKTQNEGHEENVLRLTINGKNYSWTKEYITGEEIRKLGDIPEGDTLFLSIKKPWEDELISNDTKVNLARPEIEHFYSEDKPFEITLIVNGRKKSWNKKKISFEQVVILAFGSYDPNPNKVYTVTYDRGPKQNPEGTMVKDDVVRVKDGMIFNATATDKS
ncbi:MAG: multiubiquitin domain-containing protein [Bacteroidetes bacterium]|nr:multiubiquitin domain-containing protein [Bacteroidota bacterium]